MSIPLDMATPIQAKQVVSVFDDEPFLKAWKKHLAGPYGCLDATGCWVTQKKFYLKGTLQLRELRMPGWNSAWFSTFDFKKAQALLNQVSDSDWDYLKVVWNPDRLNAPGFDLLQQTGLNVYHRPYPEISAAQVPENWERYLTTLSPKRRKRLRRAEKLNLALLPFEGEEAIEVFFSQFFPLHLLYWKQKTGGSYFEDLREQAFFKAWCYALKQKNQLQLNGLYLNDRLCSLSMAVRFEETLYGIINILTGQYSDYSPGVLHIYQELKLASDLGLSKYSLGAGNEGFKQEVGTASEPRTETLVVNPKSILGKFYGHYWHRKYEAERSSLRPMINSPLCTH